MGNTIVHLDVASTEEGRTACYQLRYQELVERLGWDLALVDHQHRLQRDSYDDRCRLVLATLETGEAVGTLRSLRLALDEDTDGWPRLLTGLDRGSFDRDALSFDVCSYTSRFVVSRRHQLVRYTPPRGRRSRFTVATAVATFHYVQLLEEGVYLDFIRCMERDEPFYTRLGYRLLQRNVGLAGWNADASENAHVETRSMMVLLVRDVAHLDAARSPFRSVLLSDFPEPESSASSTDYEAMLRRLS